MPISAIWFSAAKVWSLEWICFWSDRIEHKLYLNTSPNALNKAPMCVCVCVQFHIENDWNSFHSCSLWNAKRYDGKLNCHLAIYCYRAKPSSIHKTWSHNQQYLLLNSYRKQQKCVPASLWVYIKIHNDYIPSFRFIEFFPPIKCYRMLKHQTSTALLIIAKLCSCHWIIGSKWRWREATKKRNNNAISVEHSHRKQNIEYQIRMHASATYFPFFQYAKHVFHIFIDHNKK